MIIVLKEFETIELIQNKPCIIIPNITYTIRNNGVKFNDYCSIKSANRAFNRLVSLTKTEKKV